MSLLIECPICNETFWPSTNQTYCSDSCREKAKRLRRKVQIREAVYDWRRNNRDKINQRQRELRANKPQKERIKQTAEERRIADRVYKDQLRFSGNREKALERDNNQCQKCGTIEQLTVHHKDRSGQTDRPNNELDNLITLCASCHQDEHRFDKPKSGKYLNCHHCGKETFALNKEIGRKKYCSRECADKDKVGKLKTSEFRNCLVCSKRFMATSQAIQTGKGKYCSPECSSIGQIKRVKVNCLVCNGEFETTPSKIKVGKGKFCSRGCYAKSKVKS